MASLERVRYSNISLTLPHSYHTRATAAALHVHKEAQSKANALNNSSNTVQQLQDVPVQQQLLREPGP